MENLISTASNSLSYFVRLIMLSHHDTHAMLALGMKYISQAAEQLLYTYIFYMNCKTALNSTAPQRKIRSMLEY